MQNQTKAGEPSDLAHNFVGLALNPVVLRLGWIFKTESIIIPSVLDIIGGSSATRGWLPLLSRFAIAIPPVFLANQIKRARLKKVSLACFSVAMGICFLALSLWWQIKPAEAANWFIVAFLVVYTIFFVCSGLNQVAFGTLQGKLIAAKLRGRLMSAANITGATVAITAVWFLLPKWLNAEGASFSYIFGFTGSCFLVAAIVSLWAKEKSDDQSLSASKRNGASQVWNVLKTDIILRKTALMSSMASCSIMLFPHYQALARERLELDFTVLLSWVMIQNFGTALFSTLTGPLADWFGNRLAIRLVNAGLVFVPLIALFVSYQSAVNAVWFNVVFLMIGLTPVYIRLIQHYTLELTTPANHPPYLAAINICNAIPFVLSPLVGWLVSSVGYELVFLSINALVLTALLLTWLVPEPRNSIS